MAAVVQISNPTNPAAAVLSTHPFTCNTCQVAFRSSEQQRQHMHTDWHRYNIKRRISTLPPLSAETFAEKVLHVQAANRIERERASFEKKCIACDKTYYSENAYANHVGSMKHRQNVALVEAAAKRAKLVAEKDDKDETLSVVSSQFSFGEPVGAGVKAASEKEATEELVGIVEKMKLEGSGVHMPKIEEGKDAEAEVDGDKKMEDKPEEEGEKTKGLPVTSCLFCTYQSPSVALNISHMSKAHGLFIPEKNFLVDLEGLIRYLGYKVAVGNQCLYCNKFKNSLEAIQTHMRDVGHCKVAFEAEDEQLELGEFYDFRATYEDDGYSTVDEDKDEEEAAAAGPSKKKGLKPNASKPSNEGEEDGWETDSSASSLDSQDLCAVPLDHHEPHRPRNGQEKHHREDGWHVHAHPHHSHAVYHTEFELHMPTGRSAGHRQFARYYRQHLRDTPSSAISHTRYPRRDDSDDEMADGENAVVLSRREKRALEMGIRSGQIVKRKGDVVGMAGVGKHTRRQVVEEMKRGRKVEERGRKNWEWGVEKRGNMQKHYRDPLLQ